MKKYFSALLIILLSSFTTAPRIVWLDELDLSNVDQSAGKNSQSINVENTTFYRRRKI